MNKLRKLMFRGPKYIWYLLCLLFFYLIGFFVKIFSSKYRDVWIVSERGVDARDNGYHFYKYLRTHHSEINAYYIIDKKSVDYKNVKEYGNIVSYRSFKHHLLFAVSTNKISTHIFGYAPDILCYNRFQKLGLIKGKLIFLQHGITKDDVEWMFYPHAVLDLFVCGAKPEYDAVKARFGFPEGIVKYLGLCRFDALKHSDNGKRGILIMPTWRVSFYETQSPEEFIKTDYYKSFNQLLNDKRLLEFLERENYELVFFPHFEVQKFLNSFKAGSDRVILGSFDKFDVQKLLIESKVLVTDFSSVFFDFGYMGKPTIYFQFDEEEYRKQNYAKGYFDYRVDGFGPVCSSVDETVDYLLYMAGREFVIEEEYKNRVNLFFEMRDNKNCERNFEAVRGLN